jgi:hypothetical protein
LSGKAPASSSDLVMWMWYRLVFDAPARGERTLLHFGAVDWRAAVYLNGKLLGNHSGGYEGFSFDVTDFLADSGNELLLHVYDPSDTGFQPEGKQKLGAISNPGWPPLTYPNGTKSPWFALWGIVYTPSSGIWQTVWMEDVPAVYINAMTIDQASESTVSVKVSVSGLSAKSQTKWLGFEVLAGATAVASAGQIVKPSGGQGGIIVATVSIRVPYPKLWSPDNPHLYDLRVSLTNASSTSASTSAGTSASASASTGGHGSDSGDSAYAYFGLRSFTLSTNTSTPDSAVMYDTDVGTSDMPPCSLLPGTGCTGIAGMNSSINDCKQLCKATKGCAAYVWYVLPFCQLLVVSINWPCRKPDKVDRPGSKATCGTGNSTCWLKQGDPSFWKNRSCRVSQILGHPSPTVPLLNG